MVTAIENEDNRSTPVSVSFIGGDREAPSTVPLQPPADDMPLPPENLRAKVYSSSAFEVFWSPVSNAVVNYEVSLDGQLAETTDGISWFVAGLQSGEQYSVDVVAIDASGNRSAAAHIVVTTNGSSSEIDPGTDLEAILPEAPQSVRLVIYSTTAAELFWDLPPVTSGVVSTLVLRDGDLIGQTNGISFYDDGRSATLGHRYEIIAIDQSGGQSPPTSISSGPLDSTPPVSIVDLASFADNTGNSPADEAWVEAEAFARSSGSVLVISPGKYKLTRTWWVYPGLREIKGTGGLIEMHNEVPAAAFRLYGQAEGAAENVTDLTIDSAHWDMMNNSTLSYGVIARNPVGLSIVNSTGENLLAGQHIAIIAEGTGEKSQNIVIRNNELRGAKGNSDNGSSHSIVLGVIALELNGYASVTDRWTSEFVAAAAEVPISNVVIEGNEIDGGYYGVSFSGVVDSRVSGNVIRNNIRNISLQNNSSGNKIYDNILLEGFSSAVHMAFGSSENHVYDNSITTDSGCEGLIQAYIGSENNNVEFNSITSTTATRSEAGRYGIYFGVHASGNRAYRNTISGTYYGAGLTVESAWRSDTPYIGSRGYQNNPTIDAGYASQATKDVSIIENEFDLSSELQGIFINQEWDSVNGSVPLLNVMIYRNYGTADPLVNLVSYDAAQLTYTIDPYSVLVQPRNTIIPPAQSDHEIATTLSPLPFPCSWIASVLPTSELSALRVE